jgi:uncharacterized membrane protein YfcA
VGLLRKIILGPSRKTVAILCFPMAAGCFFFTWLNGHLVPSQVPEGIAIGIFFIVAGIELLVKERRLRRFWTQHTDSV